MAGPRTWRQESIAPSRGVAAAVLLAALTAGCKSGTWGAKPSWWTFGGTTPSTSLAAAPEFNKDVAKPSEVAKPYPTTNAPEAYSLAGGDREAAPSGSPALEPTSVTYGSTPPPVAAQPQALAQSPGPAGGTPDTIGPQVGPYASLQPAPPTGSVDPAAAVTAGLASAPAFGEAAPPAAAPRVADARGSDSWATPPAAAAATDPRYGVTNGSRFSGGFQPSPVEPPPAAAPFAQPAPPSAQPAAAFPPPGAAIDPAPAPAATLPGAIPPPQRRQDPGYRPGNTSSYRPSRAILAEDEAAPGGVVPVSFDGAAAARQ